MVTDGMYRWRACTLHRQNKFRVHLDEEDESQNFRPTSESELIGRDPPLEKKGNDEFYKR